MTTPTSADRTIKTGLQHHQAGRLREAEALYRQVLQSEPKNPDALHLLGWIAHQVGQGKAAVELVNEAISVQPLNPVYYGDLGNMLHAQGELDAAIGNYQKALSLDPLSVEVQFNLGNALQAQGKPAEAESHFRKVLTLKPDVPEVHNNLGNALRAQGNPDAAVECYRKALLLKPDFAEVNQNLGYVLLAQGKPDGAIESFRAAVALRPDVAELHYSLGNALHAQGRIDAAIGCYKTAIGLKPALAEAHNSMGNALRDQGKLDESVASYGKALVLNPDLEEAHCNLGSILLEQGKFSAAVDSFMRSLDVTEIPEARSGFAAGVRYLRFILDNPDIRRFLIRAISEPWWRPYELAETCISLIKCNQTIRECVERATIAWPARLSDHELFGPSGLTAVLDDQLLRCVLENAPACDVELERFLTMARFAMLKAAAGAGVAEMPDANHLAFYCALARQCHINEYVFDSSDEEIGQATRLRGQLASALESTSPFPVLWLAAVAAYFPLSGLPSADSLLEKIWPEAIASLVAQQVREPLEERGYHASIPVLTAVEDSVSRLVQQQYEESPYPNWIKVPPCGKPMSVDAYLRQHLPVSAFKPLGKSDVVDILIAGCGTGQHPIEIARQFLGARVLAVDLSFTSLCYAKRKTCEIGSGNIEYAQADILKLGSIGRIFDVIESSGVLHHLADPIAGWRELISLLRPGGLMRLGLYSEYARQNVVAARNYIAKRGYRRTVVDIRRCRQNLMSVELRLEFKQLMSWSDFYSMNGCRDLLFSIQEHRYTLSQIKQILGELELDFIGFVLEPSLAWKYKQRFPDDKTMTNLDCWNEFETENPYAFATMYQFFVQKLG